MKYTLFEDVISQERMRKYMLACNNESRRAMTFKPFLRAKLQLFSQLSHDSSRKYHRKSGNVSQASQTSQRLF